MSGQNVFERLGAIGVIPVLGISDERVVEPLARVLVDAGLPCAEITLRTPASLPALQRVTRSFPDLLVGAGTVLSPTQALMARDAGASFVVAPGLNPAVVTRCLEEHIPVLPGIATPTEIEMAIAQGLRALKVFPASLLGGPAFLRAVSAPYPDVRFVPTGGIGASDLADYLTVPSVLAVGGTWIASPELLAAHDFDTIQRLAGEAATIVRACREGSTIAEGRGLRT